MQLRMSSLRQTHRTPSLTSLSTISSNEGTEPIFNSGSSSNPFADPQGSTSYNTPRTPTDTYPSNGYRFDSKSPPTYTESSATKTKPKLRRFVKTFIHPVSTRREKKSEKSRRKEWEEQERVAEIERFLESGRGDGRVEGVRVQAGAGTDVWTVE